MATKSNNAQRRTMNIHLMTQNSQSQNVRSMKTILTKKNLKETLL